EEEIAVLRESVRIAEASAHAMVEHARLGVAQSEVYGQMLLAQIRQHALEPYLAWCPGGWGEPKHRYTTPPPGMVERGLHVCGEIGRLVRGYGAQIAEPLVIGSPSPQAREIFELNTVIFQRACELMRPGTTFGELEDATKEVAKGTGY